MGPQSAGNQSVLSRHSCMRCCTRPLPSSNSARTPFFTYMRCSVDLTVMYSMVMESAYQSTSSESAG